MQNQLYTYDNLFVMYGMNSASVDLIYLDPPFNSKRTYSAPIGTKAAGASFKDMWSWRDVNEAYLAKMVAYNGLVDYIESIGNIHGRPMMAYTTYMAQRIVEMRRILKPTGSIYLHCDPTASHYIKPLLDAIFGTDNFRNEIIWSYRTGGVSKKWFGRKHDTILFYAAEARDHIFNVEKERSYSTNNAPPGFKGIEKFKDEFGRWYTMAAMRDVWEINAIGRSSRERTGYPTQKPLALLTRIIKSSSNEGGVVFDPFCGCATALVAAQQLGRQWIGIDIEAQAADLLVERLSDDAGLFKDFVHLTEPPSRSDIDVVEPTLPVKKKLYKEQNGHCNGCANKYEAKDMEIDHIVPKSRGGGDFMENYQLLCGNCNRTKGSRPMEFLRMRIEQRKQHLASRITFGR